MRYTLGLDIGISSIGWAVLENTPDGEPKKDRNRLRIGNYGLLVSYVFFVFRVLLRRHGQTAPLTVFHPPLK